MWRSRDGGVGGAGTRAGKRQVAFLFAPPPRDHPGGTNPLTSHAIQVDAQPSSGRGKGVGQSVALSRDARVENKVRFQHNSWRLPCARGGEGGACACCRARKVTPPPLHMTLTAQVDLLREGKAQARGGGPNSQVIVAHARRAVPWAAAAVAVRRGQGSACWIADNAHRTAPQRRWPGLSGSGPGPGCGPARGWACRLWRTRPRRNTKSASPGGRQSLHRRPVQAGDRQLLPE